MNGYARNLTVPALALALLVATTPAVGQRITPTRHPFLWRIEARGAQEFAKPSWLYGTMHAGDRRLITLPDAVEDAREGADALYCELDMGKAKQQRAAMVELMRLPEGQKLGDRLPAKLYARLARYVSKHGTSIDRLENMQVWAVNLTVQTIDIAKAKFFHSLDDVLFKDARADGKEVGGLETIQEQIDAFTGGPETDQIEALRGALALGEKYDRKGIIPIVELLEIYLAGDEDRLLAKLKESMRHNPELGARMMRPLLGDRNVRMVERIDAKLRQQPGRSYFFAVGAMHFPGEDGMLKLMRQKGYRITRIQPPPTQPQPQPQARVDALQKRVDELVELIRRQAKDNALLKARMRTLEFKVKVLERRLK